MASHCEMETKRDEQRASNSKVDLNQMAQQGQKLFKFKILYDQVDFDAGQCLTITKAIIELNVPKRGLGSDQKTTCEGRRIEDNAMVSHCKVYTFPRLLYVTIYVYNMELKHILIDPGSCFNIVGGS